MKHVWRILLVTGCIFSVPCVYAKVNGAALAQQITQAAQPVGMKRFEYMRFFLANDTLPQEPGFWEKLFASNDEQHSRALAIYLFNMHASTHFYQQNPNVLTLNHLGVLDSIVRATEGFDVSQATKFYQANQKQIDDLLHQFTKKMMPGLPKPTPAQLHQWLVLLEKQPRRAKKPVYTFPAQNLLTGSVSPRLEIQFKPVLEKAFNQAQKQVVIYDEADIKLEDLDRTIGSKQAHRKRTYRWIKDECHYSTYLIGQLLTHQIAKHQLAWNTRIYTITALPKTEEFLAPAKGERFVLANGQNGLHWRYHTALLVIVPQGGTYTPIILDLFLGGTKPISLDQWLASFNRNTVFSAVPFTRDPITENALKTPQKRDGNNIWVEGSRYEPAPVEK